MDPLILTLAFDEGSFSFFDAQRRRYFPPERNLIPAHLTLFHKLPGDELAGITRDIDAAAQTQPAFSAAVAGLRPLGRGVAYRLSSDELAALRQGLAERWSPWLSPQDRQGFQPHVTVQNKVDPRLAKALLDDLLATFTPFDVTATGLDLWWYRGGPWELAQRFPFAPGLPLPGGRGPEWGKDAER